MINLFKKENKGQQILSSSRGFTLIETLVAISIFTTSILTLVIILSQGIADTNYAKNKIIAGYLAQEGIEFVRNMRDTYIVSRSTAQNGWNEFINKLSALEDECLLTSGCYFNDIELFQDNNITFTEFTLCGTPCQVLNYNFGTSSLGKYFYGSGSGGQSSGFRRKINVEIINANEVKISSTTFWGQASGTKYVTLSENLFNWSE